MVDAPSIDLNPPPSTPSTTSASTPASAALSAPLSGGQHVDDRRIVLPPLDHEVRGNGPVGQLAYPAQIGAALRGQGLDHAHAAALGDGGGEFGARDEGHRRLDHRVPNSEQGLNSIPHRAYPAMQWGRRRSTSGR
jgi:hypothetical protein